MEYYTNNRNGGKKTKQRIKPEKVTGAQWPKCFEHNKFVTSVSKSKFFLLTQFLYCLLCLMCQRESQMERERRSMAEDRESSKVKPTGNPTVLLMLQNVTG